MQGYVLYRDAAGTTLRIEADRPLRKALRSALEAAVPEGSVVLGLVLGRPTIRELHLVA